MSLHETNFEESRWLKINKIDVSKFADKFWVKKADTDSSSWVKAYKFQEEYIPIDDDPYCLYPIECSTGFDGKPNVIPICSYAELEHLIPKSDRFKITKDYLRSLFIVKNEEFAPFELELENSFELIKWLFNYFKGDLKLNTKNQISSNQML